MEKTPEGNTSQAKAGQSILKRGEKAREAESHYFCWSLITAFLLLKLLSEYLATEHQAIRCAALQLVLSAGPGAHEKAVVTHSGQLLVTLVCVSSWGTDGNPPVPTALPSRCLLQAPFTHFSQGTNSTGVFNIFQFPGGWSQPLQQLIVKNSSWFCCCLCFLCLQGFGNLDKYLLKWSKIQILQILESRTSVTQWRMLYMTTWETRVVHTPVQFDMTLLAQCSEDPQFLHATDDIWGFSAPEELQE